MTTPVRSARSAAAVTGNATHAITACGGATSAYLAAVRDATDAATRIAVYDATIAATASRDAIREAIDAAARDA